MNRSFFDYVFSIRLVFITIQYIQNSDSPSIVDCWLLIFLRSSHQIHFTQASKMSRHIRLNFALDCKWSQKVTKIQMIHNWVIRIIVWQSHNSRKFAFRYSEFGNKLRLLLLFNCENSISLPLRLYQITREEKNMTS